MKQKIKSLVKEYLGANVIIAAIVGALFSWGYCGYSHQIK